MQIDTHIYNIISSYILGQITEEETQELEQWLAQSPRHRQMFEHFLARRDMSRLFRIPAAHRDAAKAFATEPAKRQHIPFTRWASVAAAAVVILIVGVAWWQNYTEVVQPQLPEECLAAMTMSQKAGRSDADVYITASTSQPLATVKGVADESAFDAFVENLTTKGDIDEEDLCAQIVTHHDKEFWLTLSDGSRVHLNYGCRLTYPLQFTGHEREVTLEGEAYFMVAKDKRHPFVVHTQHGDIREYGTEFVVNTRYRSDAASGTGAIKGAGVSVVLVSGSISVTPNNGREHMMKPNDMALLRGSSPVPTIQQVDTTPFVAWNTGTFAFDNCPLYQLLEVLSHWHDMNVEFHGDEAHRQATFTGELDRYNDVLTSVHAISNVIGIKIKIVDNTIIVE